MTEIYPSYKSSKNDLRLYGEKTVTLFLKHNDIKRPPLYIKDDLKSFGLFLNKTVYINLKKTRVCVKVPGFSWSHTGYKADLTYPGVLAHEIGHYVDSIKRCSYNITWRNIIKKESAVSSYEPNPSEAFAEAMKLYILNPNLLKIGRPLRYKFMNDMNIQPLHDISWKIILQNAHPKLITAANNWCNK